MAPQTRLGREHAEDPNRRLQEIAGDERGFYRLVFSAMAEGVVLQDASGVICAWNPSAERILGLTYDQLDGLTSVDPRWKAIHEDGSPFPGETHPAMVSLKNGKACSGVTMGIQGAQGEITWISVSSRPLFHSGNPTPYAVVSTFTDISDRVRNQKALSQANELFSKSFLASPEGFAISEVDTGRYVEVNDAFVQIIGYERPELLGKTSLELKIWQSPADRRNFLEPLLNHCLIRGQEMKFRTKSGRLVDVEVSAELVQLGERTCLLSIVRDVTERKLLEEQLRQSQKMEAIGRLAGGVAHDFNNLLGVILGYGEMALEKMEPSDPLRKLIDEINKASGHAAALTTQLLAFSRKQIVQVRPTDLNAVVERVHDLLMRVIGEHIELVTTFEMGLAHVLTDPHQIEQILLNLSVNARDAMPGGGRLSIETRRARLDGSVGDLPPGSYVRLSVKDTGQGINREILPHIFEPFFTTKESGKGTGLGLATVYRVVKQSAGGIVVTSDPESGTCFDIYLPEVAQGLEGERTGLQKNRTLSGTETVLLVEDAAPLREVSRTLLEDAGYKVLDCANATEALERVQEHAGEIHLLLIDVVLRGMDGKALADKLIKLRPRAKVLYTSGYADETLMPLVEEGLQFDFVAKPYTRKVLLEKVREVLDRGAL